MYMIMELTTDSRVTVLHMAVRRTGREVTGQSMLDTATDNRVIRMNVWRMPAGRKNVLLREPDAGKAFQSRKTGKIVLPGEWWRSLSASLSW